MKNIGTMVAAIVVALVLGLYMCTFKIRFTEVAIVKTWGKPAKEALDEPGLKFKWPAPIQTVVLYDKRIRVLDDRTEETRTIDGKNVVVTTFTLWRIAEPSKFHTNFPSGVSEGEKKLRTAVITHKHAVMGRHRFEELVSTDPKERKLHEIEAQIQDQVARDVLDAYGIEVVGFGIKKIALPETVTTSIFESMKSHEQAKAARYQAEGNARANDILANAKAAKERILSAARQKVADIEAEAQRVVSSYYKEFDRHPELRIYLDALRTTRRALRSRTTLILPTTQSPFDVFEEQARREIIKAGRVSDLGGGETVPVAVRVEPKQPARSGN